ncbi:MAG: leucyl aminopeptidase family protein [Bdellovibrionaceae bacterium]|nr:leucyl aminopeptidase family protein [Pseudobdellovibrionaceae bacterium]
MSRKRIALNDVLKVPASFLETKVVSTKLGKKAGQLVVFGVEDKNALSQLLVKAAPAWRRSSENFLNRDNFVLETENGPMWVIYRRRPQGPFSHAGALEESEYAWYRDQAGWALGQMKASGISQVLIDFRGTEPAMERGLLVGLELAAYNYKNLMHGKEFEGLPDLSVRKMPGAVLKDVIAEASAEGRALNLARHLVNLPPNFANPTTVAQLARTKFPKSPDMKVEVWDMKRLEKEGMGLHVGVGQGSVNLPCMVRFRYRPKGVTQKPIAFVGKGVTFDTGGLDIKPSSAMRLMKKDMGGSAGVMGLALYAVLSKIKIPMDFYLGLAENSVDAASMRPSDVLQARSGQLVEIHNTDAEGRLVLADVLDVAVTETGKDEPQFVIDLATLTGAIKTALGTEIGGLFSNHDELAQDLLMAGTRAGDLAWRMPLYSRYTASFPTAFGDMVNAVDGWGGPITAALFLEKFVRNKPWAHFDIYAWADKASGAMSSSGGNAQSLQGLIEFLKSKA